VVFLFRFFSNNLAAFTILPFHLLIPFCLPIFLKTTDQVALFFLSVADRGLFPLHNPNENTIASLVSVEALPPRSRPSSLRSG
jgi:hypothetical protein